MQGSLLAYRMNSSGQVNSGEGADCSPFPLPFYPCTEFRRSEHAVSEQSVFIEFGIVAEIEHLKRSSAMTF